MHCMLTALPFSPRGMSDPTCSPEHWTRQHFCMRPLSHRNLTRAMLPKMVARRKGRLVLVASMAAKVPTPGQAVYSATKMAALGYFASVATEVADWWVLRDWLHHVACWPAMNQASVVTLLLLSTSCNPTYAVATACMTRLSSAGSKSHTVEPCPTSVMQWHWSDCVLPWACRNWL